MIAGCQLNRVPQGFNAHSSRRQAGQSVATVSVNKIQCIWCCCMSFAPHIRAVKSLNANRLSCYSQLLSWLKNIAICQCIVFNSNYCIFNIGYLMLQWPGFSGHVLVFRASKFALSWEQFKVIAALNSLNIVKIYRF